jgi:hypothetical protein
MANKPNNQDPLKKGTEPPFRAERPVQPKPTPTPKPEQTPKTPPPKK